MTYFLEEPDYLSVLDFSFFPDEDFAPSFDAPDLGSVLLVLVFLSVLLFVVSEAVS
ncbi:hypothetical protein [Flavobacterium sp. KBS0721]|uniref:hypothetical protein n=1 Tax=Flavobacterium sp. KBS0721 TaxID=1179672 RepID=UPI00143DA993|nr:hypothetical protein [Flavobacterium sp. KBS0721]